MEKTLEANAGAAYVFTRSGTSWSQQAKTTGFGYSSQVTTLVVTR